MMAIAEPTAAYACGECGKASSREVWHCPGCQRHWPMGRGTCYHCGVVRPGTGEGIGEGDWKSLEFHELAGLFPLMAEEEQSNLADCIERDGFDRSHAIVLFEGKILDGRNRWMACTALHEEGRLAAPPPFVEFRGESPLQFVLRENLHRRHLTATQRATLAVEMLPFEEREARQRQGTRTDISPMLDRSSVGRSDAKAAAKVGVSRGYVAEAKKIKAEAPDLYFQMQTGEKDLQAAKKEAKQRNRPPSKLAGAFPEGKFSLILADPPWRYEHCANTNDAVENHYPTMALEEICALPVGALTAEVCRLFLWVTSPKLPEGLQVMKAWGFTYATCAVWVKPSIGPGWIFRQQHELLLVGRKGDAPVPAESDRPSSVIDARKGAHSEKPIAAYELIEQMYPGAKRVELFCRSPREGWTAWGNEIKEESNGNNESRASGKHPSKLSRSAA